MTQLARSHRSQPKRRRRRIEFTPVESSGYLVRDAHRAFQHHLAQRIAPFGVTRGQWYFLRVLWTEDGLSQRELSKRVGMTEPTTVVALKSMERSGLIRRVRKAHDKRSAEVWLTSKAKRLQSALLPIARAITEDAAAGITHDDFETFRTVILQMTENLDRLKD